MESLLGRTSYTQQICGDFPFGTEYRELLRQDFQGKENEVPAVFA